MAVADPGAPDLRVRSAHRHRVAGDRRHRPGCGSSPAAPRLPPRGPNALALPLDRRPRTARAPRIRGDRRATESDGAVAEPCHPCSARPARRPTASVTMAVLALANVHVAGMLPDGLTFGLVSTIVIIVAISIGLMQRFTDRSLVERRATAAEAERRRIATELHDVIAHEITGIVVLAQAAGRSDNAQLTSTALGRIEASGTRALDEIRRLVSETRTEAASRTPIADGPQAL